MRVAESKQPQKSEAPRFCLSPSDRGSHQLVTVDVRKLDHAWQPTKDHYITVQAPRSRLVRYEGFKNWLRNNPGKTIKASTVYLSDEQNRVYFHDGRHRCAVLRDLGYHTIKVAVRRGQATRFRELFAPQDGH